VKSGSWWLAGVGERCTDCWLSGPSLGPWALARLEQRTASALKFAMIKGIQRILSNGRGALNAERDDLIDILGSLNKELHYCTVSSDDFVDYYGEPDPDDLHRLWRAVWSGSHNEARDRRRLADCASEDETLDGERLDAVDVAVSRLRIVSPPPPGATRREIYLWSWTCADVIFSTLFLTHTSDV
jgi:hypothetical protein